MKKFIFIFTLIIAFVSCEEDKSLDPKPTIVGGQYVRLDITNKLLSFDNISTTSFGGLLTTPSNNVVKYELFVRYENSFGFVTGNYVPLKTITSFPQQLAITPQELATALNIQVSDLKKGDIFNFLGYSYDANNNKVDFNNLSSVIKTQPGMKQGYKFVTKILFESEINAPGFEYDNYAF